MQYLNRYIGIRSIPAWAGETADPELVAYYAEVYPRVGGGNPDKESDNCHSPGLSPRGRGKRAGISWPETVTGSIPAWAGETPWLTTTTANPGVYPRVGGGNGLGYPAGCPPHGLSPRGRGKPTYRPLTCCRRRSIPAWAGETNGG